MSSLLLFNHNLLIQKDLFITFLTLFGVAGSILSSLCIITYFGPIYHRESNHSKEDWRRHYILIFSIINMFLLGISLLYDFKIYKLVVFASLVVVVYHVQSSEEELNSRTKTKYFVLLRAWTDILCIVLLILLFLLRKTKL
jgi:hypothetical protein